MSVKENKELVRRYFSAGEAEIKAEFAGKNEYHAPEFTNHMPAGDLKLKEYGQAMNALLVAFPDTKYTIEDMIAEGDKVVARYKFYGTHKGVYRGIAPTGKRVNAEGIEIVNIAGGRLVEAWSSFDNLGMMRQLGAIPSAPPKK
jgi:predicted ester cyclase